jgi:hypothetical protein
VGANIVSRQSRFVSSRFTAYSTRFFSSLYSVNIVLELLYRSIREVGFVWGH